MKKTELEIKKMVANEKEFKNIYNYFLNGNQYKIKEIIQKNFYFDTENFYFFKRNISIKIRLIDNVYKLIVKQQKKWDLHGRTSEEFTITLDDKKFSDMILYSKIPSKLEVFLMKQKLPVNLLYRGAMITQRTLFINEKRNYTICLDQNDYLGKRDFEIELEYNEKYDLNSVLSEFLNRLPDSNLSKYGRFSRVILENKDNYCKLQTSVIIENTLGEILLIRKEKIKSTVANKLIPPGGHVGFFESIENAARREIAEETNIDLKNLPLRLSAIVYFRNNKSVKNSICFFFYVKLPDDFDLTYKANEFDIEIDWINLNNKDKLLSNKLTQYHIQIIEHARTDDYKPLYLDIQTDKGTIYSYEK